MNILILQASPRANGNTAWMAEEYKKAAEAAGHQVTLVNVSRKKIAGCLACEYCHKGGTHDVDNIEGGYQGNGACIQKDDMQELYPLMAEAEVLVLAAPIYYFTLCAQIQAPIQRMYCVNAPAKVKKMALLMSSYSPGVYTGATAEYHDICKYWHAEDSGIVTAKIDEQKTDETKQKIQALVSNL
ncbi:MAG: flavodoxin family protein [Prevotella sp.]|nr:flavodoxin family protein [Prevotella sp.]